MVKRLRKVLVIRIIVAAFVIRILTVVRATPTISIRLISPESAYVYTPLPSSQCTLKQLHIVPH
jgi:hypothetical protein